MKDEFAKAAQNKSPVKMTAVKRKPNYFDETKTDIEVTNNIMLKTLDENDVEFGYIKYEQIDECPLVDVATILSSKKDKDSVSLHLYLTVEERSVVPTLRKYSSKTVNKNEISFIKVTFWANNIKEVPENGKYFLERVTVREWPAGILNLTTTQPTKVTPSNKEISQTRSVLPELATFKVSFPPTSIISCEVQCFCSQCNKLEKRNDGRFFQCSYCNSRAFLLPLSRTAD